VNIINQHYFCCHIKLFRNIKLAGSDENLKTKMDALVQKLLQRVFKFLALSHANILMLFFKDMSSNEFVVDLFHDKNGELRSFQDFNQLFNPQQLGVFYKVFYMLK